MIRIGVITRMVLNNIPFEYYIIANYLFIFVGLQTESDIRNEFEKSCVNADSVSKEGCITVESRVFDTDGNPANAIEDLFVSPQLATNMHNNYLEFLLILYLECGQRLSSIFCEQFL